MGKLRNSDICVCVLGIDKNLHIESGARAFQSKKELYCYEKNVLKLK